MRRLGTAIGVISVIGLSSALAGAAGEPRVYVAAHFMLELDGKGIGSLRSIEGGNIRADVISYQRADSSIVEKSLGRRRVDEFTIEADLSMGAGYYEWIGRTISGSPSRPSGAVVTADSDWKKVSTRSFRDALITEVGFPALDAASKDAARMTVKFAPASVETVGGDGSKIEEPAAQRQKAWLPSNFRLRIGDLPCARVTKIDGFVIKQKVIDTDLGEQGGISREPAMLEIPNLVITIPPVDSKPWIDWHEQFVNRRRDTQADELEGSLSYLDDKGAELARLDLSHIGVFCISLLPPEPGDKTRAPDQFFRVVACVYVESMKFTHLGGGAK